jgi:8-oxo-dGTP pyrophosphatase MutT (NUDIX family)
VSDKQKPKQAATVVLLRPAASKGFEVFLTRRAVNMPFLGGMYCFPGGGVNKEDCSPRMIERSFGLTGEQARKLVGAHFSPQEARGFWIAANRELFEEIGVLLAVNRDGVRFRMSQTRVSRLAEKHRALLNRSLSFFSLLENEDLCCDLSSLTYLSHWQTPEQNALRFDTRFFLARLPEDQAPLPMSDEVADSLWLTADRAIQLFEHGKLPLIFPTFATLRMLADFETLESVFKEFDATIASRMQRSPARR